MKLLGIIIGILLALALFYLFALMGRRNEPKMELLRKYRYAHRGLHNARQGIPENSILAFRYALAGHFGVELDVHLTRDNRLVVIHDSDLKRLCGVEGTVEEMDLAQLRQLRLQGTNERIPLLEEVLPLFEEKTPLIIEVKVVNGNHHQLCQTLCRMLESYRGDFCVESFDPRAIYWLRRNEPYFIRGQLVENFLQQGEVAGLKLPMKLLLTSLAGNLLTRPDFIACSYAHRDILPVRICRRWLKVQEVSWTIRSKEEMAVAEADGAMVIFEHFLPDIHRKKKAAPAPETAE